jgi:hypothetical protein
MSQTQSTQALLKKTRGKLYEIAGGGIDNGDVTISRLLTSQRIAYFRSEHFRAWVAAEKAAGRIVCWLKDVDKTQAAGDVFTFFYKWRVDNTAFIGPQFAEIDKWLDEHPDLPAVVRPTPSATVSPHDLLKHWQNKETGVGDGIGFLDFWRLYWKTQIGLTREQKLDQVTRFAPSYASRVFRGVPEENQALTDAGVEVVIVSNGDQELAIAIAPILGIKPENVVGSHLIYGADGLATTVNHTYEVYDKEWEIKPQPGKHLSFHFWLRRNQERFGWKYIDGNKFVIAGRDGDSASSDGGMMIYGPQPAIGNFMIDTPSEPGRLRKFQTLAERYGFGQFFTLVQSPGQLGSMPE